MSIRITLNEVLKQKRIKLITLSQKTGITLANLSILKTGKAKAVRFTTLNSICEVLNCNPGDIIKRNKQ